MKKLILLSAMICFVYNVAFSQSKNYEKGYFINNKNNKVECLIKNEDWDYNPTEFKYKTDENANSNVMSVNDIQEFSVGGEYTFKKANVKIDKSSDIFGNASGVKALNLVDDILLLRVMVEGKAVLYSYHNENYTRFFYSMDQGPITLLSYKLYYDDQEKNYRKNEIYKQELLNNLKCDKITQNDINNLEYNDSRLYDLFTKYNDCTGSVKENFVGKRNFKTFELALKASVGMVDFSYNYPAAGINTDFRKKTNFKIEVEGEANFSNKFKKWSAVFGLGYQQYSNSYTIPYTNPVTIDVDYKSIEALIGIRTYLSLNSKSYLFANAGIIYAFAMKSTIEDFDITNALSPFMGLGYLYDKKYSIELNYEFGRNLALNNTGVDTSFKITSITIGYKFL